VTPPFLRKLYNLGATDVGVGKASNNSQAVASFIKQYYDPNDLKVVWTYPLRTITSHPHTQPHPRTRARTRTRAQVFWKTYPPAAPTPFSDVGNQSHKAEVEASIDSEYIAATGKSRYHNQSLRPVSPATTTSRCDR